MKLSIVLSTYNGGAYITEQLDSILNQTRKADEVLIFDDCSTDNTPQIIKQFISGHNLTTWKFAVNHENKGWKRNFMEGIWSTSGDLVFPCDQDDIWMPQKLEQMEKIMAENPQIMVLTSNYESFYDSGKRVCGPEKDDGKLIKQPLSNKVFNIRYPGCTYCIRREFVEISKKHWQVDFPHDALFWRMGMFSDSLYSYNMSLIQWRKHTDSTFTKESNRNRTYKKKLESMDYARRVVDDLHDFVEDNDCSQEKIDILDMSKKWIECRKAFYLSKNPCDGVKLLKYINCYDRVKQYLGDWYWYMEKKIKIDVITLHAVQNYGSVLQALATQEILKQHGCDVTIIDYVREDVRYENLVKKWSGGNPIKALAIIPTILRWKNVFQSFAKKYLDLSENTYTTEDDFESYPLDADAYCTGSDQVWNSKWNNGILPCLYLSFVPNDKYKFAFSASFGQSKLSTEEINKTKPYLEQYNRISVRESEAKVILDEQYNIKNSVHLVDPTLCVSGDFWRKYETPRKIKDDYILIYNLNRSKEFDRYAVELSKRTGLKLVRFCTRYDQFYRPGKSMLVPEVFDFISLIDNAKFVLTDSFHATAFSLNLHTEPICVYPKEFGGRLESILRQTNTTQRHIDNYEDFDVVNRAVDFKQVDEILNGERNKANNFIDTVIEDVLKQSKKGVNTK